MELLRDLINTINSLQAGPLLGLRARAASERRSNRSFAASPKREAARRLYNQHSIQRPPFVKQRLATEQKLE